MSWLGKIGLWAMAAIIIGGPVIVAIVLEISR